MYDIERKVDFYSYMDVYINMHLPEEMAPELYIYMILGKNTLHQRER